ncbi:uncharacterized protein [Gossypium hirsutum]|uniref:Uncharacterized protein isoform X3 n=1 Tax=Gossypium hirsutum TaxID=3635 RepID=A0ABM3BF05_GOSHI|nr:uncharacterized protein LOC107920472 isoform X3 [Gossypium hirsutum]
MLLETKEFLSILALADRESIQARSELFAYNILPLDHGGIQQAIMKFPEELVVHLKITTLCFGMLLYLDLMTPHGMEVHEDWITRNVADVVCIVFFITKIYLIKKMHCIFYYLAMCIVIGKFN